MNTFAGVAVSKGKLKLEDGEYTVYEIDNRSSRIYAIAKYDRFIQDEDHIAFDEGEIITPTTGKFKNAQLYVIGSDCEVTFDDSDEAVETLLTKISKDELEEIKIDKSTLGLADYLYTFSELKTGKIYRWWLRNRIIRRLWHLNLRSEDIEKGKDYFKCESYQLYDLITRDPLAALFIPIGDALRLCTRFNIEYSTEITAANIARYVYNQLQEKHSYTPMIDITKHWGSIESHLSLLVSKYGIVYNKTMAQLEYAYNVESKLAKKLLSLKTRTKRNINVQFDSSCILSDIQKEIVEKSCKLPIYFYQGLPGTGKSRLIAYTIENLSKNNLTHYVLCPTAKSAGRVRDLTNQEAQALTIHMYLKASTYEEPDVFIWDETSMTSTFLVYEVLKKSTKASHVFLGDPKQLPPIAWGIFFSQIIKSGAFEVTTLTRNYRSTKPVYLLDNNSSLIESEHCVIKEGGVIELIRQYKNLIDNGVSKADICIVTSKNVHVDKINIECQMLNRSKEFLIDKKARKFAVGDKVMLKKNQYKLGLWNGDLGFVLDINKVTKTVTVEFKSKTQRFKLSNELSSTKNYHYHGFDDDLTTDLLVLAYSLTVYSAQGDEWPYVIFYAPTDVHSSLFNSFTINTALSRAKLKNIVIGDIQKMQRSLKYTPPEPRNLLSLFINK